MPVKNLKIDELLLDLINPRTRKVESQREALQGVINDQTLRLTALAEDIAEHGLNPADRLLVMHQRSPKGSLHANCEVNHVRPSALFRSARCPPRCD